jgi:putative heme-binding domain-containing protein
VLGDALEDASVDTRRAALEAAKLLRGDAGPILLERSRHERVPELRLAVVEALAAAGRIDGDEFLRLATDVNESETLRVAAARALASSETASEFLVLLLDDSRALPGVVAIALTALGRHGRVSASTLEQWSSNTDVEIRVAVAAVLGMGKVSVPRLDAWLIEMLDAKDVRLVRAAVEAIAARKIFAATELLALYKTHEDLRSQILSALTAVPFAPALDVYLDGLAASSPDARRRSAAALLALRSQIVDELVQRAENQQVSRAALPRVERVVSLFEPIVKWRVIGPFPREAPAGIGGNTSIDFSQELFGAGGTRVAWRSVSGGAPYGTVDLDTFFDGVSKSSTFGFDKNNANRINAFAHAIVDSPTERDALVLLGSSGSIRIWVNGENAYRRRNRAGRAFDPEEDLVRIRLRRGTNQIMVQSHAGIGRWRFSVRVSGGDQALDLSLISTGNHREELRSTALNYRGDPDRGWALFTRKDGPQCGRCHVVRGQGGSLGPNLMGFAKKYDRAEAIASILEPTARLTTGYTSVVVATNEGEVLTGLIRNESATFLALVDAEGNEKRIPKASIVQRQLSQVSIMPEGLVDSLSGEEFRDLVDFLMSLDGPE